MKKKIAILGSTGSIGKSLLKIIKEDKKNFEIVLLSANKDYKTLLKQTKLFKVKNVILNDIKSFEKFKNKNKNKKINIYKDFKNFNKIFKKKADYTMSSISGLEGLLPTYKIIKHTKIIAIANKEAIICGWNLILKKLKKYKTKFIPVDSEHFSIWEILRKNSNSRVEKILITASGGPLLKKPIDKIYKTKLSEALNHPNWSMGKKISIDSATMMNKVFEIIEAKNIFNIGLKKIDILIHPSSYVHAIVKFDNGTSNLIVHDTTMYIPIFNSLYFNSDKKIRVNKIDLAKLNNLKLKKLNIKRYPIIKILKKIPEDISLFETVIVSANDELVKFYLQKKINFGDISKKLLKFINRKEFIKFKRKSPASIENIIKLNKDVRLKIKMMSI
tara:strand:+ start:1993 stop:3156 length:1164 start_codon:yes stop_codon:yes gene_type:complete